MWQTVKIRDYGRVVTGKTPSSKFPEHFGEDYPFITPTDMHYGRRVITERRISEDGSHQHKNQMLPANSVCFVCIGATIGKICITSEKSLTNQQINSVVVDPSKHNPFFVYYLLSTYTDKIKGIAGGAATPIVSKSAFEEVDAIAPPLITQKKIATVLSAYDDLIENNERRIKILEEMAQNFYREWFVKFCFPNHKKVKMVDSPLGKIPEGWEVKRLGEVTSLINRGVSPKYDETSPSLVLNQKCIRNGRLSLVEARRHNSKVPPDKIIQFGDVLINSTGVGTLGRVAQVCSELTGVTADSHVSIVRPAASKVDIDYFGCTLLGQEDAFEHMGTGATGQTELARQRISDTSILLPPMKTQREFSDMVKPLRLLAINLSCRNSSLRQTRDLLLPRLISGQVNVSELDINTLSET